MRKIATLATILLALTFVSTPVVSTTDAGVAHGDPWCC